MLLAQAIKGSPQLITDGDDEFWRVDTRTPPHKLGAGVLADATNQRLDSGNPMVRNTSILQPWGQAGFNLAPATLNSQAGGADYYAAITGFVIGQFYYWQQGQPKILSTLAVSSGPPVYFPGGTLITAPGTFQAT